MGMSVAIGVGASGQEVTAGIAAAAVLGVAIAAALWWAYFDVVALVAERRLTARQTAAQVLWLALGIVLVTLVSRLAHGGAGRDHHGHDHASVTAQPSRAAR